MLALKKKKKKMKKLIFLKTNHYSDRHDHQKIVFGITRGTWLESILSAISELYKTVLYQTCKLIPF